MGLGISSWSFILCALLVFVIRQDSGARKIQLKEGSYDLQHLATKGHVIDYVMRVEGADDVEINKKPVSKDDDDDQDHDHKKLKGKYVKEDDRDEDEDSDDEDEDDHKKLQGKYVKEDDHDDDEDSDDEDEDDHKKLKGKYVKEDDHDDDEDSDDEDEDDHKKLKGKYVKKDDEHIKILGKDVHAYKPISPMDHNHMDPELNVFFTPGDLTVGKTMPIYFAKSDSSTSPKFLPREEVDQIPFSSKNLPSLLKFFSFSKHSVQAKAMKYTLKQCEFEPMEGETKFCATSLESLLDFASHIFGSNSQFKVLTTIHLTNSTTPLQNYTIKEISEISVPNIIGCHPMPYPYAVFYCHSQKSDTSMYEVFVEGHNGGLVQAAAICHMNTSNWDPDHVSFRVLNVEPGTSPVCHFFPSDNLAWVPLPLAP